VFGDEEEEALAASQVCALQCVAVCCSVLHCVAVFGDEGEEVLEAAQVCVLLCVAVCCSML